MKLVVIGFGQCGGRIADQFARINKRARSQRRIEITPGVFAVNTDAADLSGLSYIKSDYRHRILIGTRKTGGHGVGKINELGAEIARDDSDKVIDAIRGAKRFYESDAFLLIASSGGGTGSGALPVLTKFIKERYVDKPIYAVVILPFEHEESTEERAIYNSALCIKSVNQVADAVFLIDNQRYIRKDFSLRNNLTKINEMIVEPFYDLLCAGEEKKTKYIGAKTVDAGDIIQTLTGWTTIGHGQTEVPLFNLPLPRKSDFRTKSTEIHKGIQAMDEAMSELSITCDCADASRALYLLSAPHKEMNMDLVKELGDYLRGIAPEATIRNGDYPRERTSVEVTLILSGLSNVDKVREYYSRSTTLIPEFKRREEEAAGRLRTLEEVGKDIPTLL
ncbi:MAG TPA: tubulin/FtsZ family protein [Dehalococcoidales bacterium]|nr:tubulin/FtsZ family protein [Dehalococcoidales bacterium]